MKNAATTTALTVKELSVGEFHWVLLTEAQGSSSDQLLSYSPSKISSPHANAMAAWVAGYLALRAILRKEAKRNI